MVPTWTQTVPVRSQRNARQDPVLRQVNHRKPLKRTTVTKKEKTELNLKTKEVEKENKVMKLQRAFEQGVIPNRPTPTAGRYPPPIRP